PGSRHGGARRILRLVRTWRPSAAGAAAAPLHCPVRPTARPGRRTDSKRSERAWGLRNDEDRRRARVLANEQWPTGLTSFVGEYPPSALPPPPLTPRSKEARTVSWVMRSG